MSGQEGGSAGRWAGRGGELDRAPPRRTPQPHPLRRAACSPGMHTEKRMLMKLNRYRDTASAGSPRRSLIPWPQGVRRQRARGSGGAAPQRGVGEAARPVQPRRGSRAGRADALRPWERVTETVGSWRRLCPHVSPAKNPPPRPPPAPLRPAVGARRDEVAVTKSAVRLHIRHRSRQSGREASRAAPSRCGATPMREAVPIARPLGVRQSQYSNIRPLRHRPRPHAAAPGAGRRRRALVRWPTEAAQQAAVSPQTGVRPGRPAADSATHGRPTRPLMEGPGRPTAKWPGGGSEEEAGEEQRGDGGAVGLPAARRGWRMSESPGRPPAPATTRWLPLGPTSARAGSPLARSHRRTDARTARHTQARRLSLLRTHARTDAHARTHGRTDAPTHRRTH
jgi:hypothetical protein